VSVRFTACQQPHLSFFLTYRSDTISATIRCADIYFFQDRFFYAFARNRIAATRSYRSCRAFVSRRNNSAQIFLLDRGRIGRIMQTPRARAVRLHLFFTTHGFARTLHPRVSLIGSTSESRSKFISSRP